MKITLETPSLIIVKEPNLTGTIILLALLVLGLLSFNAAWHSIPNMNVAIVYGVIGLLFIVGWFYFMPWTPNGGNIVSRIDKSTGKILVTDHGLLSKKENQYSIDSVEEIRLTGNLIRISGSRNRADTLEISLTALTENGENILLAKTVSGDKLWDENSIKQRPERLIAQKISEFIKAPLIEEWPPTVEEASKNVKSILMSNIQKAIDDAKKTRGSA